MSEQIGPSLVFVVTFLGVTLVVMASLGQLFAANAVSEDIDASYSVIGGITYAMWHSNTTTDEFAYIVGGNVTQWSNWENVGLATLDSYGDPLGIIGNRFPANLNSRVHFQFYDQAASPPTHHRLDIWIVRNNTNYYEHLTELTDNVWLKANQYRDFMVFREYSWSGTWFGSHSDRYGIKSFTTIVDPDLMGHGNQSAFSFLGRTNTTVFVAPNLAAIGNLTSTLYSDHGVIRVGTNALNIDLSTGKLGAFNLIGDLLLFKLPGIPTPVNYLIGLPMWIMISLLIVSIVSRFIPTIPGL